MGGTTISSGNGNYTAKKDHYVTWLLTQFRTPRTVSTIEMVPESARIRNDPEMQSRPWFFYTGRVIVMFVIPALGFASSGLAFYGSALLVDEAVQLREHGPVTSSRAFVDRSGQKAWMFLGIAYTVVLARRIISLSMWLIKCSNQCFLNIDLIYPELNGHNPWRNVGYLCADMLFSTTAFTISLQYNYDNKVAYEHIYLDRVPQLERWMLVVSGGFQAVTAVAMALFLNRADGLNVFYWIPCHRCGEEVGLRATSASSNAQHRSFNTLPLSNNVSEGSNFVVQYQALQQQYPVSEIIFKMYATCCARDTNYVDTHSRNNRRNCLCVASLIHNHCGALRMHIYVYNILFIFFIWCTYQSVARYDASKYIWPVYVYNGTVDVVWPMVHSQNKSFPPELDMSTDSTSWMLVAAWLLVVAEVFRLFAIVGYSIGVLRNEASIPRSHTPSNGRMLRVLCP